MITVVDTNGRTIVTAKLLQIDAEDNYLPVRIKDGGSVQPVHGGVGHDASGSGMDPILVGGYASAAAPADVSADVDAVRSWHLRNGAQCVQITASGTLVSPLTDTQLRATPVPVSGTVTASGPLTDAQLRASAVPVSAASLPLPSGASTLAEQQTQTTSLQLIDDVVHATNGAISKFVAIGGQRDDAVTITATENAVAPVRITEYRAMQVCLFGSGGVEVGSSATYGLQVDVTRGSLTETNSAAIAASLAIVDDWDESDRCKVNPIVGGAGIAGGAGDVGSTTTRIVPGGCTTGTTTTVNDTTTSTTLLASNSNRLGATIFNDSTADLYVKFGTTASSSSFAVKIAPYGYYEVPFHYSGVISGIWSSNTSGQAVITELT